MAGKENNFNGTCRRKITYSRMGEDVDIWATAIWLQIGGLVSVAAHFHDGLGGTHLALAHSRVTGLIFNSITGQAVQCKTVMGDDLGTWRDDSGDAATWIEATVRVCLESLCYQMASAFSDDDKPIHPWLRTSDMINQAKSGT